MKTQTAVEWLVEQICGEHTDAWEKEIEKALEMEKEQIMDFQLYMHENEFISNHLWDFEDMAIKFLNSKKQGL